MALMPTSFRLKVKSLKLFTKSTESSNYSFTKVWNSLR